MRPLFTVTVDIEPFRVVLPSHTVVELALVGASAALDRFAAGARRKTDDP
jgi:hypothetical protein